MSLDPSSSDLYISFFASEKAYVYNVYTCGCVTPRRILTLPSIVQHITIDRNGQHLIGWYATADQTWYFYDLNPQTGAVQRTYPPLTSNSTVLYTVQTVLAQ